MRGCQLEAASVDMSARRGIASVSMNPRLWHCAGNGLLSKPTRKESPVRLGLFLCAKTCLFYSKSVLLLPMLCYTNNMLNILADV